MRIDIPYEIGDEIIIDGEKVKIKGLHCFIDKNGELSNVRAYTDRGGEQPFVPLIRKTLRKGK